MARGKAALVASDSGAPLGAMLVRPQGHAKNKQIIVNIHKHMNNIKTK